MDKKILFVCTGNSCRSPMAEVMFKKLLEENFPEESFKVGSAGVAAFDGASSTIEARQAVEKRGLDLSQHRARAIAREMLDEADIVFTMTQRQKEEIKSISPEFLEKVFILREYVQLPDDIIGSEECFDIEDPIGGSSEVYEKCADIIDKCLRRVIFLWKEKSQANRKH